MHRGAVLVLLVLLGPRVAGAVTVRSGSLRAEVGTTPFSLSFAGDDGRAILSSATDGGPLAPSGVSVSVGGRWIHATRVTSVRGGARGLRTTLETDDMLAGTFALQVSPAGDGAIAVEATFTGGSAAAVD